MFRTFLEYLYYCTRIYNNHLRLIIKRTYTAFGRSREVVEEVWSTFPVFCMERKCGELGRHDDESSQLILSKTFRQKVLIQ